MNAFSFASVPAAAPTKVSRKAKTEASMVFIAGSEELSRVIRIRKELEALEKTMAEEVKSRMGDHFVDTGMKRGARPDNFKGFEGAATASCELRIRSSSSPVNPDERATLADFGIPVEEIIEQEECFKFNNEALADPVIRAKVEKALSKAGLPANLIIKQESRVRYVVAANALDVIFEKIKDSGFAKRLMGICGVMAFKPKLNESAKTSFAAVADLIDEAEEAA